MKKRDKCTLLDRLLNEGWFRDEREASAWAMERKILVNDQLVTSVKEKVYADSEIRVKEYYKTKYVNKGGLKLEGALNDFNINVTGLTALDCGASTGGFTDCLLVNGASLVYAVDVGFGQLAGKLLNDSRVINMERTNLSDEKLLTLNPKPEIITLDLSYLSLKRAVPFCREIMNNKGQIVALIKPLFEVESAEIRQSGKINDRGVLEELLKDICLHFRGEDLDILGLTYSHIRGNADTLEYFIHLSCEVNSDSVPDESLNEHYEERIREVLDESFKIGKFRKNQNDEKS